MLVAGRVCRGVFSAEKLDQVVFIVFNRSASITLNSKALVWFPVFQFSRIGFVVLGLLGECLLDPLVGNFLEFFAMVRLTSSKLSTDLWPSSAFVFPRTWVFDRELTKAFFFVISKKLFLRLGKPRLSGCALLKLDSSSAKFFITFDLLFVLGWLVFQRILFAPGFKPSFLGLGLWSVSGVSSIELLQLIFLGKIRIFPSVGVSHPCSYPAEDSVVFTRGGDRS